MRPEASSLGRRPSEIHHFKFLKSIIQNKPIIVDAKFIILGTQAYNSISINDP